MDYENNVSEQSSVEYKNKLDYKKYIDFDNIKWIYYLYKNDDPNKIFFCYENSIELQKKRAAQFTKPQKKKKNYNNI